MDEEAMKTKMIKTEIKVKDGKETDQKTAEAEVKGLRREIEEDREIKERLRKEVKKLEAINQDLNTARIFYFKSYMQEITELEARIMRLRLRVEALGLGEVQQREDRETGERCWYRFTKEKGTWEKI